MINVVSLLKTKHGHKLDSNTGEASFWAERGAEYAEKLFAGFAKHGPWREMQAFLMTDAPELCPVGVEPLPLAHPESPGWWAKLGMFKPAYLPAQKTLYCDLDNVICGPLAPLLALEPDPILMTDDSYIPQLPNGSLMLFQPTPLAYLWEHYAAEPEKTRINYQRWPHAADQAYIAHQVHMMTGHPVRLLQNFLPERFLLNSRTELEQGVPYDQSSVVIGGHLPKPHTSEHPFYKEHWS